MAKLSWNNVVGQSTNAGSEALGNAGALFNRALNSFKEVAEKKQSDLVAQNTAQITDQLRNLSTTKDFETAAPELTTEALTQKFGAGNFDPTGAVQAIESKRKTITGESRADLNFKQKQAALAHSLKREAIQEANYDADRERTLKIQAKSDQRDADRSSVFESLTKVPSIEQEVSINAAAANRAIARMEQAGGVNSGDIRIDASGNPAFSDTVDVDKRKAFIGILEQEGYSEFGTLSDKITQFRELNAGRPEEFIQQGEQALRDRFNRNLLSDGHLSQIASKESTIAGELKTTLDALTKKYERDVNKVKPGQIKSEAETLADDKSLKTAYDKMFPDAGFGSSISGNLGGSEGWEIIQDIRLNGLVTDNGTTVYPPPSLIEQVLPKVGVNLTTGVRDAFFDEDELKKTLLTEMAKTSFLDQTEEYLNKKDITYATDVDRITNVFSKKAANAKNEIYRNAGIADKTKAKEILRFGQ